jgi:two-component system, response regulator PdtaR
MAQAPFTPRPDNHTVLVVEDEPLVRIMLAEALRGGGLDIIEAASAGEALRVLNRCGQVDLILTDVELGRFCMDGLSLVSTVQEQHPHIRIVIVSGKRPEHLPDGTAAFFPKPYLLAELVGCVKEILSSTEWNTNPRSKQSQP